MARIHVRFSETRWLGAAHEDARAVCIPTLRTPLPENTRDFKTPHLPRVREGGGMCRQQYCNTTFSWNDSQPLWTRHQGPFSFKTRAESAASPRRHAACASLPVTSDASAWASLPGQPYEEQTCRPPGPARVEVRQLWFRQGSGGYLT